VSEYKVVKTAMGRKFRVRMDEDEIREKKLFRLAVTLMPLIGSMLMFWLWLEVRG